MQKTWSIQAPPFITFGSYCSENINNLIKSLKVSRVLLVTDKVMVDIGVAKPIQENLKKISIDYVIYDGIDSEPTDNFVLEGLKILENNRCDCIIALGGGSPIDTAKAISVMAKSSGSISDYMGIEKIPQKGVTLIAIPTTAGTGSEVTKYTIITNTKTNVKMLIGSSFLIPDAAIVDPMLTVTTPKGLTAATGIDALTHAIEAYTSIKANPTSDLFATEAIKLISKNLRDAWVNGKNIEAREKVMLGSMYAGLAFGNSSVALVHGMSRPIGANFHVAHGVSNASLLGVVMDFSYSGSVQRYAAIASAMGEDIDRLTEDKAAKLAVESVKALVKDLGIPSLSGLGIKEEELKRLAPKMANDAIASGSPGNNPRVASQEEIVGLYMQAFK